tara:strand:+ start:386 stop:1033 length:648 start_codon:yes stop_codon:yes gene_type:complete
MNINNPTSFSPPDLTLTTANSSGSAGALRADDSILVYDTTLPDAITFGQSGAVGTASVSARRDHAHAMASSPVATYSCRAYNNANISIANATTTAVALNAERWDTDTMHDTSTNNSRITIKTAGVYVFDAQIRFADNTTGDRMIDIVHDGSTEIARAIWHGTAGTNTVDARNLTVVYNMAVDEYVEMKVWQNSGGALNIINTAQYGIEFTAARVL